ncbi:hypothetical protein T03_14069 [Trichinella britovi]|uniref:Uncharacterized protein n=1 Tax=Trichinella britovi TaxID=45882 RepID=A0A0V1AK20_TRIBR|nr:hypothetical protein T03_14069 [Trichinella britovi]
METSALFFSNDVQLIFETSLRPGQYIIVLMGNILAQLFKGNVCHRDTPVAQSHP